MRLMTATNYSLVPSKLPIEALGIVRKYLGGIKLDDKEV